MLEASEDKATSRIAVDRVTGVIRVDGAGFWAPETVGPMFDQLTEAVGAAHAKGAQARVLVDLRENGAQRGDTVGQIQSRAMTLYTAGDRLAVVLKSNLLKMQVARVERAAEHRTFDTVAEAEAWLSSRAA